MRKTSKIFFGFIGAHKVWSVVISIVIIFSAWYLISNNPENVNYTEVAVTRGSVSEIVSVTGNVKPVSDVSLAFERGGRVSSISVAVGDQVYLGQNLASVSNADLVANLNQAKANLKKIQAGLGDNASQKTLSFAQAETSLADTIRDTYTKADDAVRNKIYSLFVDPTRYNASLYFTADTFLQEDIEDGKDKVVANLEAWYRVLNKTNISLTLENNYNLAKTNLISIKSLLDKCAEAVNGLSTSSSGPTQTQIDTWKLNISTARTNINTAIDSLTGSYNSYKTADLTVKISGNSTLAEEADIEAAQANIASAEAELFKSIIRSPISGVITKLDTKLGEIVPANKDIISVISYGDYEVESFIPEADISKIKIGNSAFTTLDAYGDSVTFNTSVVKVDPAATVIDGVPTYKVTLKFTTRDERVRSGMTANLDILTNKKEDVLILPSRVVISREDGKYVSVIDPNDRSDTIDQKVITGLRGSDGNVEIVSGLNLEDKVIIPIIK